MEPIASLKVTVPDDYTGDVMGDLNKRRGRVLGMNPVGSGKTVIEADVPMTGMFGYCTVLRSMTGGRGTYAVRILHATNRLRLMCRKLRSQNAQRNSWNKYDKGYALLRAYPF